jgi:hypothetical protein
LCPPFPFPLVVNGGRDKACAHPTRLHKTAYGSRFFPWRWGETGRTPCPLAPGPPQLNRQFLISSLLSWNPFNAIIIRAAVRRRDPDRLAPSRRHRQDRAHIIRSHGRAREKSAEEQWQQHRRTMHAGDCPIFPGRVTKVIPDPCDSCPLE